MDPTYGVNTGHQKVANTIFKEIVSKSLKEMMAANPSRFENNALPFHILDLGSCHGKVLLDQATHFIEVIRASYPNLPIRITCEDADWNEFNLLLNTVEHGFSKLPNVYVYASARCLFNQVVPDNDVDLIISGNTFSTLTFAPETEPHWNGLHYFPLLKEKEEFPKRYDTYLKRWIDDYVRQMSFRAKELRPGGRIHFYTPNTMEGKETEFLYANSIAHKKYVLECFAKAGLGHLGDVLPWLSCMPTREMQASFFEQPGSPLKLLDIHQPKIIDPIYEEYKESGDLDRYAQRHMLHFASIFRVFFREVLMEHLKDAEKAEATLTNIFEGNIEEVKANIKDKEMILPHGFVSGEKPLNP